jgi:hypothetical protein
VLANDAKSLAIIRNFNSNMDPQVHVVPRDVDQLAEPPGPDAPQEPRAHEIDLAEREGRAPDDQRIAATRLLGIITELLRWGREISRGLDPSLGIGVSMRERQTLRSLLARMQAMLEALAHSTLAGDLAWASAHVRAYDVAVASMDAQLTTYQTTVLERQQAQEASAAAAAEAPAAAAAAATGADVIDVDDMPDDDADSDDDDEAP